MSGDLVYMNYETEQGAIIHPHQWPLPAFCLLKKKKKQTTLVRE